MMHRLFTHDDARFLHVHKILGVTALVHFAARLWHGFAYGHLGFRVETLWAAVALHSVLSLTSLQFHLPSNRVKGRPMIWPEARIHSIGFTMRSTTIMALHAATWQLGMWSPWLDCARGVIVLHTMVWADTWTHHFKHVLRQVPADDSTMRHIAYPKCVPAWYVRAHNYFYSTGQVFATMSMMLSVDVDTAFLVLIPIQASVFLMTLVRKGFISTAAWHIIYTATVLAPFLYKARKSWLAGSGNNRDPAFPYMVLVLTFCVLRFRFRVNKYFMWASIMAYHWYMAVVNGVYRMELLLGENAL